MKLKYQENLEKIKNCPLGNQKGEKKLYRCVENPMTSNSFEPHAVLYKPKYQDNCLAWGVSLFSDSKSARETLNSLSLNKRQKINFTSIASGIITDEDGIKHSSNNKKHYTFYPTNNLDLINRFVIVNENE